MDETPQPQNRFLIRQMQKRHLAAVWAGLAGLQAGMSVLDIGSGPGLLAAEYARLVGPTGMIYVVEPKAKLHAPAGNIYVLRQDAALPINMRRAPDIVFITDTLHHAIDPAGVLKSIRAICRPKTKIFIAEYDPQKPGLLGAKREKRVPPAAAIALLTAAGFTVEFTGEAPDEHYAILAHPA